MQPGLTSPDRRHPLVPPVARALTISTLAALAGTTIRAIRYYEEQGLIAPVRSPRNIRLYPPAVAARACRIVELRRLGISLADVTATLEGPPDAGLEKVLQQRLSVLDGQRAAVRAMLDHIRPGHRQAG